MAAAAVMRTADRASAISYSALPALSTRVVVRGKGNNIIGQRPLLKRAIIAQASLQTGKTEECQLSAAPSALGTFAAALTPYVAVLASALVAASPAAATLAPGEILQLQETLTEVWGKHSYFVMQRDHVQWKGTSSLFEPLLGDVKCTTSQWSVKALRTFTSHMLALNKAQVARSKDWRTTLPSLTFSALSD